MPFLKKYKAWFLIFLGSFIWSLTMIKSGLVYSYGMGFWGANGHDGVWHLSLIESLARRDWGMPVFAGLPLHNYHFGFDLLLAVIKMITHIPASVLYFQLFPPLLAVLTGISVYKFVDNWQNSKTAALWSVFFVYFGGSFGWLVSFLRYQGWGGESMFWSQQAISTLINPPFALSSLMLIWLLLSLHHYIKSHQLKYYWLSVLLLGTVGMVKIYAGILGFSGLFIISSYLYFKSKNPKLFYIFALSLALFLVIFLPFNSASSRLLVFKPFWFLDTMMGLSDRLNWPRFYSAMTNYRLGANYAKLTIFYVIAAVIFIIGNFGTRLIGIFHIKSFDYISVFIYQAVIIGFLFPMLFLQTGTPWNTIQFFYYSQFFMSILAGLALTKVLNKYKHPILRFSLCIMLIAFTLPTTVDTLKHYLPARPPAKISRQELDALSFLSRQPRGTVIIPVFNSDAARLAADTPPRPLYLYESTAYVSAFSIQPVFLEDEVNLNITNYDWQSRRKLVEQFFKTSDSKWADQFLTTNHIRYLYLSEIAKTRPVLSPSQLNMHTLYENSQTAIWEVN